MLAHCLFAHHPLRYYKTADSSRTKRPETPAHAAHPSLLWKLVLGCSPDVFVLRGSLSHLLCVLPCILQLVMFGLIRGRAASGNCSRTAGAGKWRSAEPLSCEHEK